MYLKVSASPRSKREEVAEKGSTLLIKVREPAERNRANTRVREIVAERYGVPVSQVRIVNGHHSSSKLLSVPD